MLLEHWFVHSKVCRRKVNPLLWAHPRETLLFHFEDEKAEDRQALLHLKSFRQGLCLHPLGFKLAFPIQQLV